MATTVHMGRIPAAPPGMRVRSIRYSTCPGTSLRFLVVVDNSTSIDDAGVVSDAWWVVRCDGLPDRTFRMWGQDIGDTGLVEATEPSLVPSLSLTFDGTENSFIVNDWTS